MIKEYERIVDAYRMWHPKLYDKTIKCTPCGPCCILASLDDGVKIEYDAMDNTIRDVTNLYVRESVESLDENIWRKEFGRKLHRAIVNKGLTQEGLSEITGVSRQMLSRYIRGTSTPSGYIISKFCEVLDCDARELTKIGYID